MYSSLHNLAGITELLPAVYADRLFRADRRNGHNLMPAFDNHRKSVGKIKLTLGFVGRNPLDVFKKNLVIEKIIAWVDFLDFQLFGRAVGVFDDAQAGGKGQHS